MADLAALQRQFYDYVTGSGDADGLVARGELDVYANMYHSRLYDALVDDYPKLHAALGEDAFAPLARDYLRAHRPTSFTLRELGAHLPAYLRAHADAPPWASELAALERARLEAFDAGDCEPLAQETAAALGEQLPELVLQWVTASAVISLTWSVDEIWSAIEDDEPIPAPVAGDRVVLVWRSDTRVLHRTLDDDEAPLAEQISRGVSFAALCEQLGAQHADGAVGRAAELLIRWLQSAVLRSPES